jgi:phospholipid/cholesterol/gamma-HCH transport system permease protein
MTSRGRSIANGIIHMTRPPLATSTMTPVDLRYVRAEDGTLRLMLAGEWKLGRGLPAPSSVLGELERQPRPQRVTFDTGLLAGWDSGLLTFLLTVFARCSQLGISVDDSGLPGGVKRLLAQATAVPERQGARVPAPRLSILERIGDAAIRSSRSWVDTVTFVGDVCLSLLRLVRGKARFRRSDLLVEIQSCGARSLAIISLVNFLVGLILAFVGAVQLRMFGAQIYVAHLVGIATVREIAAIMTGVVVTGRTGASFAAQLGTMQVNEEIDALRTLGLSPVDFLVLPRVLALSLMMPLLCLYADVMGILGGLVVGVAMLDIKPVLYWLETRRAIHLADLLIGLFMSVVFGVLVALTGTLRGLRCGRSAAAVGEATTSAVVTGIVSIVVATAVITWVCYVLGI